MPIAIHMRLQGVEVDAGVEVEVEVGRYQQLLRHRIRKHAHPTLQ